MYEIIFDEKASDFLSKLPKEIKKRIFDKITSAKENPDHYFRPLTGRTDHKLRVGDYRIIADINKSLKRIEITFIGHRKNVYD